MIQIYVLMQHRLQWNEIIAFRIPARETEDETEDCIGIPIPNISQFTDFNSSG